MVQIELLYINAETDKVEHSVQTIPAGAADEFVEELATKYPQMVITETPWRLLQGA